MTTSSTINAEINAFVASQNQNRGQGLPAGGTVSLDYNALSGLVPTGGNAVTGIAGIAAGAAAISLPAGQNGNAVIIDGAISTSASTSGTDSYSLLVDASGHVTLTDNNTGNSETISGASYLLFDGGATASSGAFQSAYIVESGVAAQMASMYNAAYGRVPDLPGLEFHIDQFGSWALPDLHTMAIDFLSSSEFKTHWPTLQTIPDNGGVNDQAYINALYGQILHRTPSTSEVQFYIDALQGTLKDSNGHAIAAADRAELLVYFSLSPENQADISAKNGGWLINSSAGATALGAMSSATVTTILTSEAASGTVSAGDFAGMSSSGQTTVIIGNAGIVIAGADHGAGSAAQVSDPGISTTIPNLTINLSSQYFFASIYGNNDTVNGPSAGGAIINLASTCDIPDLAAQVNAGGTVNLAGNINWLQLGNTDYASSVAAVVHGWNSADILIAPNSTAPYYGNTVASLLASPDGHILSGSASSPVSGTSIPTDAGTLGAYAINVGHITDDTVSSIVSAANLAFKENGANLTDTFTNNIYFFGQDSQGNTMVWYWRGDTNHTGTVQASDITGGVELVGIQASSLTGANFHH